MSAVRIMVIFLIPLLIISWIRITYRTVDVEHGVRTVGDVLQVLLTAVEVVVLIYIEAALIASVQPQ